MHFRVWLSYSLRVFDIVGKRKKTRVARCILILMKRGTPSRNSHGQWTRLLSPMHSYTRRFGIPFRPRSRFPSQGKFNRAMYFLNDSPTSNSNYLHNELPRIKFLLRYASLEIKRRSEFCHLFISPNFPSVKFLLLHPILHLCFLLLRLFWQILIE